MIFTVIRQKKKCHTIKDTIMKMNMCFTADEKIIQEYRRICNEFGRSELLPIKRTVAVCLSNKAQDWEYASKKKKILMHM
jgi:hypothetical protein